MIEQRTLLPSVTLRACRDTRFKQGCLSFQLLRPMDREQSAKNALLPAVLLRGTEKSPDLRAITARLDTLYGATVSPLVRRVGDYQTTGFYCGFIDDCFALPGDRVLGPMLEFLEEILLNPLLENGVFPKAFVSGEKKNLISAIESDRNDKRIYAMGKLLKTMCQGDSFGLPRLGEPEQVAAITEAGLYDHYRRLLRESPIEIFYVGSASIDAVAELLRPMLARLDRAPAVLPPQTPFRGQARGDEAEIMDVSQGKLCLGYTTPITNRDPEFAAMQVANTVFGAGMTSKLFQNVREKLSLCYSVGSAYYSTKGIVTVSAGIDFDKEARTREEIAHQLGLCQAGQITQEELTAAKEALLSSLRAAADSPGALEGYYATAAVSGLELTHEAYMEAVKAVDLEAVTAAARTITPHTSFFLRGGSQ